MSYFDCWVAENQTWREDVICLQLAVVVMTQTTDGRESNSISVYQRIANVQVELKMLN